MLNLKQKTDLLNLGKKGLRFATRAQSRTISGPHFELDYIHYQNRQGPALFFIHGFSDMPESFIPLGLAFKNRFNVYIPALPGFDDRGVQEGKTYNLDNYTNAIIDLIDRENLSDVHLVGNSLGGLITLNTAIEGKERIKSISLINSAGAQAEGTETIMDEFFAGNNLFMLNHRSEFDRLFDMVFYKRPRAPQMFNKFFYQYMKNKAESFGKITEDLFDDTQQFEDGGDIVDLSQISCATKVIWGVADQFFPTEIGRAFADRIPNASLTEMEKTGHCPHMESPIKLKKILEEFLLGLETKSSSVLAT